jgi:hypothetical protein
VLTGPTGAPPPTPQVASQLLATAESLIERHSAAMGMACLVYPEPTGLPAAGMLLGQGCGSSRSASSIKQALASYQHQLNSAVMLSGDDTPSGTPGSFGAAGGLAAAAAAPEGWQHAPQAAGGALHPGGLGLGTTLRLPTGQAKHCVASAGGGSEGCSPTWPPAATAVAEPCSMIEQLQSALSMWEDLKANARTPSTVLRMPLAPQLVECSSSAALQCSCA